ncbi:hydrolase of the alpha/beta superfamily [Plectosphaerella plurivora]|uniref:Hydrolase of the alpha/beta superfamily n=1 Tax=Plectosphaerella plurivora TaxID=936078 RepID=A0A9P8V0A0_9PEZI|nr:hydrolase of the alpha/beta superfamily [Plectosphaerella plurivora]
MAGPRSINYPSRGLTIAADLYLPLSSAPDRKGAALVVGHPGTGIKEQASGLYARRLAEAGFITLAFDAAYYGESGGTPRGLEDPAQRVEDIKCAATYLATEGAAAGVDPSRIGLVGICASGGYGIFAAATDMRLRAVAVVSLGCFGQLTRESMDSATLRQQFAQGAEDRLAEARGEEPTMIGILDVPGAGEAVAYYRTEGRGKHPRSKNEYVRRSIELMAVYDSFAHIDWIAPRPILMIMGSEAVTRHMTEGAFKRAAEPKELIVIEGKQHVDLYDDTSESVPKMVEFLAKALAE